MSGWVRLWEDMPTDPKWRVVARKSGQAVPSVIAVFTILMVEGGKAGRSGDISGARVEDIAAALDMDDDAVSAIIDAMQGRVIDGHALSGWDRRQPKREDTSTQRVKEYRERKKQDVKRAETQCNAPEAEAEAEAEISDADASDVSAPTHPPDDDWPRDFQDLFWRAYPHRVGKSDALAKLDRIRKSRRVTFAKLMSGLDAYIASKPPDRQWCNPATWLNQGRWDDEPNIAAPPRGQERSQHELLTAFDRLRDHAQRMEDAGGPEGRWSA
ncbi:hypothetical protein [Xanthobacter agilis]|uniref:DNA-binding MarR family transcriptional regulator n=1 Tax=Xanthobacter agilis TaxID=47492 RepID=A0ABU0LFQ5_XANAG|nr:hypothetical protein [Xanthobacter agilis]MDQ0505966.1 DNA-binding MarR family transcriptional regulator [Xanthobacter agilis]